MNKIKAFWLISIPLTGMTFFTAIGVPQVNEFYNKIYLEQSEYNSSPQIIQTGISFTWPLNKFGISQTYSLFHPGIDLAAPNGELIYAVYDGIVIHSVISSEGYGNHIVIKHNNGIISLYAHLSTITVYEGQTVNRSSIIGSVGSTGHSTGNHLHLEIHEKNIPLNPLDVLPDINSVKIINPFIQVQSPSDHLQQSLHP